MPATRLRNFVFTWNNPPENHEDLLKEFTEISYIIYQKEEAGQCHLQGYIELSKQMSFRKVGSKFAWHIESRRGTQQQAIEYCSKDDTRIDGPFSWGEKKQQGSRTDIDGMYAMIKEGSKEHEIAEAMPSIHARYFKAHDRYRGLLDKISTKDFRTLRVSVFWGTAGSGKTKRAIDEGDDWWILNAPRQNGALWFDGYEGESTLIIDDFYGWIKYYDLLRILDGYQLRLEIKGGFRYAKWTRVIVTSNKEWSQWYPNVGDLSALRRRIHDSVYMDDEVLMGASL